MSSYLLLAKVGLVGVLVLAVGLGIWRYGDNRFNVGKAVVQGQWDLDKAKIAQVTAQAIATANEKTAEALAVNRRLHDEYTQTVATLDNGNNDLARRLRLAESRAAADRRALQETGNRQGSSPPSSAPSNGSIDDAIAAALTECRENASQLDTLVGEVTRQMGS